MFGDLLQPSRTPNVFDLADAPSFGYLSGSADDDVGFDVVGIVEGLQEGFGRVHFGIGMILPECMGLDIAIHERRSVRRLLGGVCEFLQDGGGGQVASNSSIEATEEGEDGAVWLGGAEVAGELIFDHIERDEVQAGLQIARVGPSSTFALGEGVADHRWSIWYDFLALLWRRVIVGRGCRLSHVGRINRAGKIDDVDSVDTITRPWCDVGGWMFWRRGRLEARQQAFDRSRFRQRHHRDGRRVSGKEFRGWVDAWTHAWARKNA